MYNVKTEKRTLELEVGFCEKGKPVCCIAGERDFSCQALRPRTLNARGDLVQYCGLGGHRQLPLRKTSEVRNTVRPNKTCPLHAQTKPDKVKAVEQQVLMTPPNRLAEKYQELWQVGRVSTWYFYINTKDFEFKEFQQLEKDLNTLELFTPGTTEEKHPESILLQLVRMKRTSSYKHWNNVTLQKVMLSKDGYFRECLRILRNGTVPEYIKYEIPRNSYSYAAKLNGVGTQCFTTAFTPDNLKGLNEITESTMARKAVKKPKTKQIGDSEFHVPVLTETKLKAHDKVNKRFMEKYLVKEPINISKRTSK